MQNRKRIFEKILRRRIKFIHIIIRRVYSSRFFIEEIYIWIIIFIIQNILRIKMIKKYFFLIFIFNDKIHFSLRRKFFTKKNLSKHQNKFKERFLKISFFSIKRHHKLVYHIYHFF